METLMELIAEIFIRSWFGSAILHIGAGLRYGGCGCSVAGRKCHTGKSAMARMISAIWTMPTTTLPTAFLASSFSQ